MQISVILVRHAENEHHTGARFRESDTTKKGAQGALSENKRQSLSE